ncbi:MAG: hypothetical protein NTX91_04050 [candidate division SR1 bacterium]|nr:hypothetical protein [candidate division SR1 bacterium]
MVRPAYFFLTIVSLLLAICSWSLAQEEVQNDLLLLSSGQDLTQVDTGEKMALELASTGAEILSLSGENLSGASDTGTQSGNILVLPETGNIVPPTPLPTGQAGPSLLISEVFFDGSDERLELTNLGQSNFSGAIQLTGIGINVSLFVAINSGGSVVVGRTGRTFSYILDTSVIGYFASMGFTDTKMISVNLFRSGQLLDTFYADTGMVNHYNDKLTSLERVWQDGIYIVTGTTLDRQLNVSSAYLANPGSFEIAWLDFSDPISTGGTGGPAGRSGGAGMSGEGIIDCSNISPAPLLNISEIFRGNEQRDFYIEIVALQDFSGDEIILSGSFLNAPVNVSLSGVKNHLEQGRRVIIYSGKNWENESIIQLDNQKLAGSKSGGFLEILRGTGQSGQVMDIVSILDERIGSSLYFRGNSSACVRKFDTRGRFSPGFDEKYLRYFPGTTGYKIICEKPVTTNAISSSGSQVTGNDVTGVIAPVDSGIILPEYMWKSISIENVDYDPPGSDTNNEKITFRASSLSGMVDFSKGWYLMINTKKRYLRGNISNSDTLTLQASFSFPNSSKNGIPNIVQLWNKEILVDSYSYIPEEEKKELTGENILSGDLLSGEEFLSGWQAKILWIIPNSKGKDDHEMISFIVQSVEGRVQSGNNFGMTGFSFLINGKKKVIRDQIPIGEETILSGSFSFPNKAACVSLVFQTRTFDTICYPQPKEGETIYADGKRDFVLSSAEQSLVSSVALKKIGNTMCAFYGNLQIDCNTIPSGKTAIKTEKENKLYESFINILQPYLQQNWGNVFYQSQVYPYFTLLRAAKKNISAGLVNVPTSHGAVSVYDLSAQLHVMETFSPGYWAKKFGQVLLNEI